MANELMLLGVGPSGVGINPASFSGLQYWFDATRIVGKNNNDPISTWSDLSGNGRDATQATGSQQPLYKTSRINGKPTVLCDGVDDSLATAGFTLNQPVHIFMVITQPTYVANGRVIDGASGNSGGVVNFAANATLQLFAGSNGPSVTPGAGAFMLRAQFNGASSKIGFGTNAYQTADAGANNPGGLRIGAFSAGTAASNTEFGEIFAYNAILSAQNETAILTYLSAKWGT